MLIFICVGGGIVVNVVDVCPLFDNFLKFFFLTSNVILFSCSTDCGPEEAGEG